MTEDTTQRTPLRLAPFHPSELSPEQRDLYDAILGSKRATQPDGAGHLPGPFNAMLLSPAVGQALQSLGAAIRFAGVLPPRALELAILAVATDSKSEYEWSRHARIALKLGVPQDYLDAICNLSKLPDKASPLESQIVELARKLIRHGDLSDDDYFSAIAELGRAAVFEISTIVGYYRLIALQLRLFRVEVNEPADA